MVRNSRVFKIRLLICCLQEETFGPIIGIQKVSSDEEALKLMNDSPYGLTASVWTDAATNPDSAATFLKFADELETGTVFLNRSVVSVDEVCFTEGEK